MYAMRAVLWIAVLCLLMPTAGRAQSITTKLKEQIRTGTYRENPGVVPERFKRSQQRRKLAAQSRGAVTGSLPRTARRRVRTAEVAQRSIPTGREARYAYCRHQVFLRYGWRHGNRLQLYADSVVQMTDACVSAGGRVR